LALLSLLALVSLTACRDECSGDTACARTQRQAQFRIYDPTGRVAAQVLPSDIVASSVRSGPDGAKTNFVTFELTPRGKQHFHQLTAGLARRGAALHRVQHFALEVHGHVYARPYIDYRLSPDGFDGQGGVEIAGVPRKLAGRFVH
jgi:hypothetical protein